MQLVSGRATAREACRCSAGDRAEALIRVVKDKHADALVVGRRGRGQLEGLLLGSVSQKLASLTLRGDQCAVILIRVEMHSKICLVMYLGFMRFLSALVIGLGEV